MKKRDFRRILAGAMAGVMMLGLTACGSAGADSASFPSDTVNIVCHSKEGGGSDALSREVAQVLQDKLGWSVTVENKTGGSGSVGMQYVQNSKPDGYTIGTAPVELSMIQALGYADLNPDSVSLLGCGMSWSAALYVPKDAPYETLEDFISYCKENPDVVRVANSGIGSIWHIAACVLADKADISSDSISPRLSLTSSLMRFCVSSSVGLGPMSSDGFPLGLSLSTSNDVAESGGGEGACAADCLADAIASFSSSLVSFESSSGMGHAVTTSSSDLSVAEL